MENYVPPNFFPDKSVILPNDYLKKTHTLQPI